jgi:hypothetical protein
MATAIWTGGASDGNYSTAANWSTGAVPTTSDNVYFTADYNADVTAGLNQSGVTIGTFTVDGYTGKLGSKSGYLQIDPGGAVEINGTGLSYLDLGNANVSVTVTNTARSSAGNAGLYLLDSNLSTLALTGGSVGFALNAGETSTVGIIKMTGGTLSVGDGGTLSTVTILGGTMNTSSSVVTLNIYGGLFKSAGSAAMTTLNGDGGTVTHNSTGTITTANVRGVFLDLNQSLNTRTITTLAPSANGSIAYDPNFITISNRSALTKPVRESWTDAF